MLNKPHPNEPIRAEQLPPPGTGVLSERQFE
jgi:hypothetical protein